MGCGPEQSLSTRGSLLAPQELHWLLPLINHDEPCPRVRVHRGGTWVLAQTCSTPREVGGGVGWGLRRSGSTPGPPHAGRLRDAQLLLGACRAVPAPLVVHAEDTRGSAAILNCPWDQLRISNCRLLWGRRGEREDRGTRGPECQHATCPEPTCVFLVNPCRQGGSSQPHFSERGRSSVR